MSSGFEMTAMRGKRHRLRAMAVCYRPEPDFCLSFLEADIGQACVRYIEVVILTVIVLSD
jgi:hypothetical protein